MPTKNTEQRIEKKKSDLKYGEEEKMEERMTELREL
jgi:hypothetical protein